MIRQDIYKILSKNKVKYNIYHADDRCLKYCKTFPKIMAAEKAILYGYKFSSCSWRVRAALQLKKISYEERAVDIVRERTQLSEEYRAVNPAQKVPALVIDGETLIESMAILQYLEDSRPEPKLTPDSPLVKARMWEICETIVSGIQPLQNIGLKPHFDSEDQYNKFTRYWCDRGLQTLEELLSKSSGRYCLGDQFTVADLCLVPQLFNATTRLQLTLDKYPTLSKLFETLLAENIFQQTHPKNVK